MLARIRVERIGVRLGLTKKLLDAVRDNSAALLEAVRKGVRELELVREALIERTRVTNLVIIKEELALRNKLEKL